MSSAVMSSAVSDVNIETGSDAEFRYYMHDGPAAFSFEIAGRISNEAAEGLERIWQKISSRGPGRTLIVDLSYVTAVESLGRKMLRRWFDHGAELVASLPQAKQIVESITGQRWQSIPEVARQKTWFPVRFAAVWALALVALFVPVGANAADLKPETIQTWDDYVRAASARNEKRFMAGNSFLLADETPGRPARLRGGEIIVAPVGQHIPLKVPSGLIHDWIGAAFIPGVTIADVLPVVRDYGRYKDFYGPNVADSKSIATGEMRDEFSVVLINNSLISKTAVDSDYQSLYTRLDDQHWFGVSEATRIQEVVAYGTPFQHVLPQNQGTGLIWRLHSVTRFEERDGGVYVEVEVIMLSRDIPASLRWFVDPIVRRISRSSLTTSLAQTGEAVQSSTTHTARLVTPAAIPPVVPATSMAHSFR